MELKVLQTNIQSLKKNKEELRHLLIQDEYSVACLQEIWTKPEEKIKLAGFNIIQDSREDGYGGSAIVIKKGLRYKRKEVVDKIESIQVTGIELLDTKINIISVYVSPRATVLEIAEMIRQIDNHLNNKTIVVGDFNSHHTYWGDSKVDAKGKCVLEEFNYTNYIITKNEKNTCISNDPKKRNTSIDLTIATQDMVTKIKKEIKEQHIGNSNHRIIEIGIKTKTKLKNRVVLNKQKIINQIRLLDDKTLGTIKQITSRVEKIIASNRIKTKYIPKSWWNRELKTAMENRNSARRKYNQTKSILDAIDFKKKAAILKVKLKLSKIKYTEKSLEKVNQDSSTKELWELVNKVSTKEENHNEENIIHNNDTVAKEFLNKNFGKNVGFRLKETDLPEFIEEEVLIDEEIWTHIINRKKKSAPGTDNITYEMLKNMHPKTAYKIIEEINYMWRRGKIKKNLKRIKIVAIPKPGKDQHIEQNYRIISLISTIIKVCNSAVLRKINRHCELNKTIPETSFGFRKKRSTQICTNFLHHAVQLNKKNNLKTGIIFIDLENAYNNVKLKLLIDVLIKSNMPSQIIRWVAEFLRNRTLEITTNNKIIKKLVTDGLPQGDVMSPTLFNIYTRGIHSRVNSLTNTTLIQYADDFIIIAGGCNDKVLKKKIAK